MGRCPRTAGGLLLRSGRGADIQAHAPWNRSEDVIPHRPDGAVAPTVRPAEDCLARATRRVGRMTALWVLAALLAPTLAMPLAPSPARAQGIDLSQGGPITVTARDGIEWRQYEQQVIARGNAKATRDKVTITADRLIAWYRRKGDAAAPATQPGTPVPETSVNEVYRLRAEGNVRIFTETEQAFGDVATYDIDEAVMVMTGRDLRLVTPNEVLTARDVLEYWSQKRMAVARGNATILTSDSRQLNADTLVAYMGDAPATPSPAPPARGGAAEAMGGGKLEKVEAFGNIIIRSPTEMVSGDRGVYVPELSIARLLGNVRITRGQSQLNGQEAVVNMKTGVSRLISDPTTRVQGLVLPNDPANRMPETTPAPTTPPR